MSEKPEKTIKQYDHEDVVMHMGHANRRMLVALIVVCMTFIATIIIFVSGYTQREKNWLDTLGRIQQTTEVADGKISNP